MTTHNPKASDISYHTLSPAHFDGVIALGNRIQGEGYLSLPALETMYKQSWHDDINASFVAMYNHAVVGFRLTFAHSQWQPDNWCSIDKWPVDPGRVCYFKCNTVDDKLQGCGIGSTLLGLAKEQAKAQGAQAGLAHIWLASPGNSAYRYFSKNGGKLIAKHPGKWRHASIHEGYDCPVCPGYCECEGAEMLLTF
ncbi:GNAT family N-acetyltransferase [Aestuariibacter sp. A3R04]|uniref:GNAT family N-acetyltransferase n=1 Tax=Aestuariibacter sp. A3R04 TaxID=2841571 RepID=UPI001C099289|nr:GNAT family N-acetyltransferase [Aestuariibacter sp. A3R04]MBU3021436.1 GNAT family N-acetyltransferase [Aestuariibacter sp. A3R04]